MMDTDMRERRKKIALASINALLKPALLERCILKIHIKIRNWPAHGSWVAMDVINMLEARKALHTEYANSLENNSSFTSSTMLSTPKSPKKKPIFEPFGMTFGDDATDSPLGSRRFSDSESTEQKLAAESRPQVQYRILAGELTYGLPSSEFNFLTILFYDIQVVLIWSWPKKLQGN
jgi:hypothetical protein